MKIKYLSLSLILLTGCVQQPVASADKETPTIPDPFELAQKQKLDQSGEKWMNKDQREYSRNNPFPDYEDIPGCSPYTYGEKQPQLGLVWIDDVFDDNIIEPFGGYLMETLDKGDTVTWYHVYRCNRKDVSTVPYILRINPEKDNPLDIYITEYEDRGGIDTLEICFRDYRPASDNYNLYFLPLFPDNQEVLDYLSDLDAHLGEKDFVYEAEYPEILGTVKFTIEHSYLKEEGHKYRFEYKTKSAWLYNEIQDSDYEVH